MVCHDCRFGMGICSQSLEGSRDIQPPSPPPPKKKKKEEIVKGFKLKISVSDPV